MKNTEKLLQKLGFSPGDVDGLYTKNTQKALDRLRRPRRPINGGTNGLRDRYALAKRVLGI